MSESPNLLSLQRVQLGPHHHVSRTKHTRNREPFPAFVALEIGVYPGEQGCYLFHIGADGRGTDTWHKTVDEATEQAEWEFGVRADEWIRTA